MASDEMVEISKEQLETYQRGATLLEKLWGKMEVKRWAKEAMPDLKIPEIDLVEQATGPINEKLSAYEERAKKLEETIEADRKAREEEKQTLSITQQLEKVRKDYSLTDEGLQKVVDRMKEKGNPDVEAAAAYIVSKQPKPEPVAPSGLAPEGFNIFGTQERDDTWEKLHQNPMRWFDNEVAKILAEPDQAA